VISFNGYVINYWKLNTDSKLLMNTLIKRTFFILAIFSAKLLHAQADFRPGYVIRNNGDTLRGEVDHRGDLRMSDKCSFKGINQDIHEYSPNELLGYRFIDGKNYVSKDVNGKGFFLEYLIKGKISIFYLREDNTDRYYLVAEDGQLREIPYENEIKSIEDKKVFYESKKHIGLLSYYMKDAPALRSSIEAIRKPEHKNLIKLASRYHKMVTGEDTYVVYEKVQPSVQVLPEIVAGIIRYSKSDNLIDQNYLHMGLIANISMPKLSKNIYFRTGVFVSQLELEDRRRYVYKIPLQLEYIYPKGIFRPRCAYGVNILLPDFFNTLSFDVGANIKLHKSLFLSIMSEIGFTATPAFIVPENLLSYSGNLGLFIKIR
jgi:hypothetical protein